MSKFVIFKKFFSHLFIAIFLTLASSATASDNECSDIQTIELETFRGFAGESGRAELFRLEIPAAGILTLEVAVPITASVSPKLGFLPGDCGELAPVARVLTRSPHRLTLAVPSSGAYFFRTAAQDSNVPLGEYRLDSRFWPATWVKTVLEEVDPNPADPVASGCRPIGADDHADTFTCATLVEWGESISGELGNGWGDDVDVLAFSLDELTTVEIAASGTVETFGALYDRSGQRLASDTDPSDPGFHLAKTLSPGHYWVRVAGEPMMEGSYTLMLTARDW